MVTVLMMTVRVKLAAENAGRPIDLMTMSTVDSPAGLQSRNWYGQSRLMVSSLSAICRAMTCDLLRDTMMMVSAFTAGVRSYVARRGNCVFR